LIDGIKRTENCSGLNLILALSYSARWEIVRATKLIANDVAAGKIQSEEITAELISQYLDTKGIPDPELMIRTSGEQRLSNFLLWQMAYTELYFTPVLWPDFSKEEFFRAIVEYQNRERRFGKISEQL
jgi:undecaprenyl diphosphate synthase